MTWSKLNRVNYGSAAPVHSGGCKRAVLHTSRSHDEPLDYEEFSTADGLTTAGRLARVALWL